MSTQLLLAKVCFNDFYELHFIRCEFQITGDHLFNSPALILVHDVSISAKLRILQKQIICLHFDFYQVENGITLYLVPSDHSRITGQSRTRLLAGASKTSASLLISTKLTLLLHVPGKGSSSQVNIFVYYALNSSLSCKIPVAYQNQQFVSTWGNMILPLSVRCAMRSI